MKIKKQLRLSLTYFLTLCLLLQAGASAAFSSYAMASMQANKTEDSLLICTGKTVKWISGSHYFKTGEFVEIKPSIEDESTVQHDVSCVFSVLADTLSAINHITNPALAAVISTAHYEQYERELIHSIAAHTQARAPPFQT